MDIEQVKTLTSADGSGGVRIGVNVEFHSKATLFVPADQTNRDYRQILAAEATGDITIQPAIPAPAPIVTTSRIAFVKSCATANILDATNARTAAAGQWPAAFDAFITAMPIDDQLDAITTWKNAEVIQRNAPLIAALQAHIGLTDAQVDALFGV